MAVDDLDVILLKRYRTPPASCPETFLERSLIILLISKDKPLTDSPKFLCILNVSVDLRGPQQGFGWNTAPIEANASQMLPFYNRGFHTRCAALMAVYVPTRPTANDNRVEGCFCHRLFPIAS